MFNKIAFKKLPNHIAFIIDGNGRWATKRGLPRNVGHSFGIKAVKECVDNCIEFGIKYISFFAFSTENWNRPQDEIDGIFVLLQSYLENQWEEYKNKGVRLHISGDITKLPESLQKNIEFVLEETKNCDNFVVNICLNYGGRADILQAINHIIVDQVKFVDDSTFKSYLYTSELPDPDFIIRTSNEKRLSNFFLYQSAYSELYFPKQYWPSFNRASLIKSLKSFQKRKRKFGAIPIRK